MQLQEQDPLLYLPEKVRIKRVEQFTAIEYFYEVELLERKNLGHHPGQFVQVSLLGIGEAPISVSSMPTDKNTFELCVRTAGELTSIFNQQKEGGEFFIRGPFGHGFDQELQEEMLGKHLIFVAGGCGYAPLRSLINLCLSQKERYKKISILYGCKTPKDRLYQEELDAIKSAGTNVELLQIVDRVQESGAWKGDVGLITGLIPKVLIENPKDCVAAIVGPPVMYKFVIQELLKLSIPKEQILVSLERRMKCAVGKCGHCQICDLYGCQDGPVFRYSEIEDNEEAL